jgi:hypothetical protein
MVFINLHSMRTYIYNIHNEDFDELGVAVNGPYTISY